jgi:predicted amidohydrolase
MEKMSGSEVMDPESGLSTPTKASSVEGVNVVGVQSVNGVNVAIFQGQAVRGDVEANLAIVEAALTECGHRQIDLVLFPELFLTGYDCSFEEFQTLAQYPADLERVAEMARSHNCAIAIGYPEIGDPVLYNSCALFDSKGRLCLNYRKTHLWDPDLIHEKKIFVAGCTLPVGQLFIERLSLNIKVGILICFDCEFPEPARALALQGIDILLIPTAIADAAQHPPTVGDLTPTVIVPCRAMENHIFVMYANLTGACSFTSSPSKPNPVFCGQSCIIGIDGRDLARASRTESELITATLSRDNFVDHIQRNNYLLNRRPELYMELSETKPFAGAAEVASAGCTVC